ncbi:Kinesin-like protein klp-3 [Caenorhabditis elegans]|uniref:Kinesin-like protein klp-3 n=1 Tax=Caenorhabditis elegans TaxID=6239 RepID=KLP3_CAEEL|nr:Kinesin-like protein klp-3 [Caenorhabditis elegans]P45962.1 RecName: Full=Kinesin-like protein klp-3 [Caenorhabditis elegans]CAA85331.1 Kinesin-like protein klp-3 [Caenorhabditis elegans]|eukprot:NP_001022332.1 Kinesin-like protein klp-3 [Caenorhabditis elegans]
MDSHVGEVDIFQQCKYIHEVELVNMKLQMRILETHIETKDRLLRNLEDIIDEQESRIANMEDFIQGRATSYTNRSNMLKGISVLSLDFGNLSEENLRLKNALSQMQKVARVNELLETDEDYESDMTSNEDRFALSRDSSCSVPRSVSPQPTGDVIKPYPQMVQSMREEGHWKKLQRCAEELKTEKDELKRLALDTKDAFNVCMAEMRMMLTSKTTDFFRVLIERYKAEMEKRKQLHNQLVELNGNIRVFYRIRPQLASETDNQKPVVVIDEMDNGVVHVSNTTGTRKTSAGADKVIPTDFSQDQIFNEVSPIITSCIDGYNVCIFAYGHTGSGKTYTMDGPVTMPGINQRAIMQLFETAKERTGDIKYDIKVAMMEIYNEKIRDLLNTSNTNLAIRQTEEGRSSIPGLEEVSVNSAEEVTETLARGRKNKAVAATEANIESSRSHVIVRVLVSATNLITKATTVGRLNLVDLAGSERVSQTNATGQLLKEAQAINKSLSELGNVVLALRQNQKHIPFRNCQLTRILEDSLNGDSKTLVIVHLSPDAKSLNESISSVNFAEKIGQVFTKSGTMKREPTRRSMTGISSGQRREIPASPRK